MSSVVLLPLPISPVLPNTALTTSTTLSSAQTSSVCTPIRSSGVREREAMTGPSAPTPTAAKRRSAAILVNSTTPLSPAPCFECKGNATRAMPASLRTESSSTGCTQQSTALVHAMPAHFANVRYVFSLTRPSS